MIWKHVHITRPLWACILWEPLVTGKFPSQRTINAELDVFFDFSLSKLLNKYPIFGDYVILVLGALSICCVIYYTIIKIKSAEPLQPPYWHGRVGAIYVLSITLSSLDTLAPGKLKWNFRYVIFKRIFVSDGCRQETSHYLSQCWPRSQTPYGVTGPQWVKGFHFKETHCINRLFLWITSVLLCNVLSCFSHCVHTCGQRIASKELLAEVR